MMKKGSKTFVSMLERAWLLANLFFVSFMKMKV